MTRRAAPRAGLVSGATADDWLARAVALAEAGRGAEARKAALRALKAEPGNALYLTNLGLALIGANRVQEPCATLE